MKKKNPKQQHDESNAHAVDQIHVGLLNVNDKSNVRYSTVVGIWWWYDEAYVGLFNVDDKLDELEQLDCSCENVELYDDCASLISDNISMVSQVNISSISLVVFQSDNISLISLVAFQSDNISLTSLASHMLSFHDLYPLL
jgi:hypothetical protein